MTRHYRRYTDQDIIDKAKEVYSLSKLLNALGLIQAGGNFINMKRNLQRLKVDTSHWKHQGWNKDQQLKNWSEYTRVESLKKHLLNLRKIIDLSHFSIMSFATTNQRKSLKI